jgi:hypothetical protein
MPKTMAHACVGKVAVTVHSREPASDAEWAGYIQELDEHQGQLTGILVFTAGGAMDPGKRATIMRIMERDRLRVAVLTDSMLLRGVIAAWRVINAHIKGFEPDALQAALDYHGVPADDRAAIESKLEELRAQIL